MLINAIEHGNLGITFDEKTAAMEEGSYFQPINERQGDYANMGRKVVADYLIEESRAVFRITDGQAGNLLLLFGVLLIENHSDENGF